LKQALKQRYDRAVHRQQSAIAFALSKEVPHISTHLTRYLKHLRVGVNNALADQGALVSLLIEERVITQAEYEEAIVVAAEREADRAVEYVRTEYQLPDTVRFA